MRYGYTRISTADQTHDLQVTALQKHEINPENIFSDTITGTSAAACRRGFDTLRRLLRTGDELFVWKLDRLGRSMVDCVTTIDALHKEGIRILTIEDNLDSGTDFGRAMLGIMASLAELERETIRRRVKAGVEAAKVRGIRCGRPRVVSVETAKIVRSYQAEGVPVNEIARRMKISRSSLYNALRFLKNENIDQ